MLSKNLEGKSERESSKRRIPASGGLELLQMVLGPDMRRYASEEAKYRRGWTRGGVPVRVPGLERGCIRGSHKKGTSVSEDAGL